MNPAGGCSQILTINGGSSSIKFAVFTAGDLPVRRFSGQIARIGAAGTQLIVHENAKDAPEVRAIDATDFRHAADALIAYIRQRLGSLPLAGIGHRVVHGGAKLIDSQLITPEVVAELRAIEQLDLAHLPREISLIEAFGQAFPEIRQVACFDTAFHRNMPRTASMLPIPRHYFDQGVRRFGFHGLSFTYLMERLTAIAGERVAHGRIILAHLGSGASMAAVRNAQPVDTTMAFTPTAGLVMGTRPGDLDPGLLVYLLRREKWDADEMDEFISSRCGLLGISETTSDMQELLRRRAFDERAAEAVGLFCYQARKFIGALSAAMDGLDTIVFSGGIGEHAPEVRAEICVGLAHLGVILDPHRNSGGENIISGDDSRVDVRVIATDEEVVIAKAVSVLLK